MHLWCFCPKSQAYAIHVWFTGLDWLNYSAMSKSGIYLQNLLVMGKTRSQLINNIHAPSMIYGENRIHTHKYQWCSPSGDRTREGAPLATPGWKRALAPGGTFAEEERSSWERELYDQKHTSRPCSKTPSCSCALHGPRGHDIPQGIVWEVGEEGGKTDPESAESKPLCRLKEGWSLSPSNQPSGEGLGATRCHLRWGLH